MRPKGKYLICIKVQHLPSMRGGEGREDSGYEFASAVPYGYTYFAILYFKLCMHKYYKILLIITM